MSNAWPIFRRLLNYVKPHKTRLAGGILFGILFGASSGLLALVVRKVWASVIERPEQLSLSAAVVVAALVPAVLLLRGALDFLGNYCVNWVGLRAVMDLRQDVVDHLQALSLDFYNESNAGEVISRATNDTGFVQNAIGQTVEDFVKQPFTLLFVLGYLLYLAPMLTVLTLIVFPVCLIPITYYGRRVRKATAEAQARTAGLLSILHEAFTGARVIKSFSLENIISGKFRSTARELFGQMMRAIKARILLAPMIEVLAGIGIAFVFLYTFRARMSGSELVSFVTGAFLMYEPVKKLSRAHLAVQQTASAASRVFEILDAESTVKERPDAVELPPVRESIRYENVSFEYASAKEKGVLHNVTLEIRHGQVVAIVGPSGAGKTTLVNLLPRFYDPTDGAIKIDGRDIRDATLRSLRRQIGIVSQETFLFNDTVANNIAFGKDNATKEEIIEAARRAHAHDFILQMPQQYDTPLGEAGVKISGGQRQRIAIARAILRDPPILILDEATSQLDSESERAVQEALDEWMWQKGGQPHTVFVIAHRLSTVQRADLIIVLDKGRVVEQGKHDELLAHGGVYQRLHALQFQV